MSAAEKLETLTEQELTHLRNCSPLRRFDDGVFSAFVAAADLISTTAGEVLFTDGEPQTFAYYLLSGDLEIFDHQQQSFRVAGGSTETLYPITAHSEARVKAVTCTPMRYAKIDLKQLEHINSKEYAFEVQEITDDTEALDARVLVDVFHALQSDELVLPSLPEVAVKIRAKAECNNTSVDAIASIVQTDPSTSAYCIGIANSAAYQGARKIADIREAVVRMGVEATRDSVTAYTLRSLYQTKNPRAQKRLRSAWSHSCRIAATSFVLAKKIGTINPERAMLAGLLHEIGTTVLVATATKLEGNVNFDETFRMIAKDLAGPIGAMVLRAWHFPDSFVDVVLEPENYRRETDDNPSLQDIVVLAHYHDDHPPTWSEAKPDPEIFKKYRFLQRDAFNEDHRLRIIDEAAEELESVLKFLNA